jgi:DNA-binding protein H-NS
MGLTLPIKLGYLPLKITGMNVEALLSLRTQIDKRLLELRAELEKQLAALSPSKRKSSSGLKGRKVPPKYRSAKGETWAGRGARPRWLVAALKKGKKPDDFLIDKSAHKESGGPSVRGLTVT